MARVLIVGCGCRGRALARVLVERGYAVRGTTREPPRAAEIEAVGAEAAVADPDRLGTLTPAIEGVSVLCWLLATAEGGGEAVSALHGPRLESMLEAVADTPVRGVVYESAGTVSDELLSAGSDLVRQVGGRFRMPVAVIEREPGDRGEWLADALRSVERVLEP